MLRRVKDRKSTRLNSSHQITSYAVFCLKKKNDCNARENSGSEWTDAGHQPVSARDLAIPEDVHAATPASKMKALAALLGISPSLLRAKLAQSRRFLYLKRQIPVDVAEQIAALKIPGIYQSKEYRRYYPEGEIAAQLIGFTNVEDEGQEGIELSMQPQLAGLPGSRRVIKDRLGRIVEDVPEMIAPRDGEELSLSIDNRLQYIAYTRLKKA